MIVYLEGNLRAKESDHIIVVASGVGYQVFLSKPSLERLKGIGENIQLSTHQIIREDQHLLFGFLDEIEKALFLKLIQVNSIGPKMALNILSGLPAQDFAQAIHQEDLVQLTAISGIGKKTAERLVVDLKDKIFEFIGNPQLGKLSKSSTNKVSPSEEAISALVNLGYTRMEAAKALQSIPESGEKNLENLVREGLKALS